MRGRTIIDRVGQTFHRLTIKALHRERRAHATVTIATCRCSCGTTVPILASAVIRGFTTSCGCWRREASRARALARRQDDGA